MDRDAEARGSPRSPARSLAAPAAAAARPVSGSALLAIDHKAGFRNYLPTRMLAGFTYASWSKPAAVLRVTFREHGRTYGRLDGRADHGSMRRAASRRASSSPATRSGGRRTRAASTRGAACSARTASRCGSTASSTTAPTQLADVGLGTVAASREALLALLADRLHHEPLAPPAVELGVEDLLPRAEVEAAVGDRRARPGATSGAASGARRRCPRRGCGGTDTGSCGARRSSQSSMSWISPFSASFT